MCHRQWAKSLSGKMQIQALSLGTAYVLFCHLFVDVGYYSYLMQPLFFTYIAHRLKNTLPGKNCRIWRCYFHKYNFSTLISYGIESQDHARMSVFVVLCVCVTIVMQRCTLTYGLCLNWAPCKQPQISAQSLHLFAEPFSSYFEKYSYRAAW